LSEASAVDVAAIEAARVRLAGAVGETRVELTLETSGREQIAELLARLRAGGYRVEERGNQSGR
jgi:hypothetical protein